MFQSQKRGPSAKIVKHCPLLVDATYLSDDVRNYRENRKGVESIDLIYILKDCQSIYRYLLSSCLIEMNKHVGFATLRCNYQ